MCTERSIWALGEENFVKQKKKWSGHREPTGQPQCPPPPPAPPPPAKSEKVREGVRVCRIRRRGRARRKSSRRRSRARRIGSAAGGREGRAHRESTRCRGRARQIHSPEGGDAAPVLPPRSTPAGLRATPPVGIRSREGGRQGYGCDNPPRKILYYRLRPIHFGQ
jgi:hypothetical protein